MPAKRERLSEVERLKSETARIDERFRVCAQAVRSVSDLIGLSAEGNRLVVHTILMLALLVVDTLDSIVKTRPKLGRWLARDTFVWPGLLSRKRPLRKANDELLKTLQLGKRGIFSVEAVHLGALSIRGAMIIFSVGQWRSAAGQGPRLSRKNKKKWFDNNWEWLLGHGFAPEQHDVLRKLGASKAWKKPKFCKQLHPATSSANVRAEIKARVWEAFNNLVYRK
jgi:hypothetical protein